MKCNCTKDAVQQIEEGHDGMKFQVLSAQDTINFGEKPKGMSVTHWPFTLQLRSEKKKGNKYIRHTLLPTYCCFCGESLL